MSAVVESVPAAPPVDDLQVERSFPPPWMRRAGSECR